MLNQRRSPRSPGCLEPESMGEGPRLINRYGGLSGPQVQ